MPERLAQTAVAADVRLSLLNGFELQFCERSVNLPPASQRLVAFLALNDRPLKRIYVAASLWLDTTEGRSRANLRSALWRLVSSGAPVVDIESDQLRLSHQVVVDVASLIRAARRLLDEPSDESATELDDALLAGELLPDWYDDWVLFERDRVHQLRMHALEIVAERLARAGAYGEAMEAGLAAVRAEPLRESAQRILIRVHLAEGNRSEALVRYRSYRDRLRDQLSLAPSPQMEELISVVRRGDRDAHAVTPQQP